MYDLVIRNGTVVDGTGLPRYRADVAVQGDRIAATASPEPSRPSRSGWVTLVAQTKNASFKIIEGKL